jgi:hypothetical protein
MAEPKERRITGADWDKVQKYVKDEHESRKKSDFRKKNESLWKEVDRQVSMEKMEKRAANGQPLKDTWQASLELGELAKASEIICADVVRIMFPQDRSWFTPHVKLDWPLGPDGKPIVKPNIQKTADGLLRNLMAQQHKDFGFKSRFRMSVKEALHHGSFVAETRWEDALLAQEDKIATLSAPVWVPYSMWNTYPDPSPSVIGTNRFYTGSMILVEFMPLWKLKKVAKGDGWMPERLKKVNKQTNKNKDNDTEDVELVKYFGDIVIERGNGDIYLPNTKVIIANGICVYYAPIQTPYPPVIFAGYERQDVRDPYYTSPIIKLSPTQKAATVTANKFLDAMALKVEPPVEYDSNDPDYVEGGGPQLHPGAKNATKSVGQGMKALDVGEPTYALKALEMFLGQMQQGLGVSSLRSGAQEADRQTATEATLLSQGSEVRTMEFINQLESQALTPWLYMQHWLNRSKLQNYTFFNDEVNTPDFITASSKDVDTEAHFEVIGSRGILGEERRNQKISQATAFFLSNPLTAQKINTDQIIIDMYRDAGKKNPEEYLVKQKQVSPQQVQQMQQVIQQLQQELAKEKAGNQAKLMETEAKSKLQAAEAVAENQRKDAETKAKIQREGLSTIVDIRSKRMKDQQEMLFKSMEAESENDTAEDDSELKALRESQQDVMKALGEIKKRIGKRKE